jgi:hypothetical protein
LPPITLSCPPLSSCWSSFSSQIVPLCFHVCFKKSGFCI